MSILGNETENQQKLVTPDNEFHGDDRIAFNYTGPSMNPTLQAGDGMIVVPYEDQEIQVGDVVVFQSPEQNHYVVHRVLSVNSQGIRTIGDNNNNTDPWVLQPTDIMGRVVSVRRKDKDIIIHGSARGKAILSFLRIRKRVKAMAIRASSPIYQWLTRSGIIRRLFSPVIRTRLIYFKRPGGTEIQLLIRKRVIARLLPGEDKWRIRRPYRLLVDEAILPDNPGNASGLRSNKSEQPNTYPC